VDVLSKRIQKVVESVLENESLVSGLDESASEILQGWGIKTATSAAEKTDQLDDERAEREMYPQLKASRRLMRAIRVWLQQETETLPEQRAQLWAKIEKRAKALYGEELSLPSPEQFSGGTQAEFIQNLLDWFEKEN